jgi:hypothetical protein
VADHEIGRFAEKGTPFGNASLAAQPEIDAAMNAAVAKMALQR